MVRVEFHFDFGSPNAYLAHLVIPEIERRTGVEFEYVPILLGGVFKLTNNRSPAETLKGMNPGTDAEGLQSMVFEVGKRHPFPELRAWFGCLYQVLLGQQEGPRFGGFVALYGIDETVALIEAALSRPADAA